MGGAGLEAGTNQNNVYTTDENENFGPVHLWNNDLLFRARKGVGGEGSHSYWVVMRKLIWDLKKRK